MRLDIQYGYIECSLCLPVCNEGTISFEEDDNFGGQTQGDEWDTEHYRTRKIYHSRVSYSDFNGLCCLYYPQNCHQYHSYYNRCFSQHHHFSTQEWTGWDI